ncbi:MAG: hypothetical protein GY708_09010 [Actinomycetia bacterium]|nr:hypothetical protein [Actinomycetes bacterium]
MIEAGAIDHLSYPEHLGEPAGVEAMQVQGLIVRGSHLCGCAAIESEDYETLVGVIGVGSKGQRRVTLVRD